MGKTGIDDEDLKAFVAKVAGDYAVRAVTVGVEDGYDLSTITQHSMQVVPITEQAYLQAGGTQAQFWAPRTGAPMLDFPLLAITRAGSTPPGAVGRGGRAIAHWFNSNEGREAIAEAYLRDATGAALPGAGLGKFAQLPTPAPDAIVTAFSEWSIAAVPSSVLTVYDLSASMRDDLGGKSRIGVAVETGMLSLDVLPTYTRIDARVGNETHGDILRRESIKLVEKARGGTKLFNTVEAAYETAIEAYNPAYNNSVVIFTDGGADDCSTIDLAELVERLKKLRDPDRPVHFVMIGISQEADSEVLNSIAQATGGSSFIVNKADDMIPVLASALLG
jgi:hypothetical protein